MLPLEAVKATAIDKLETRGEHTGCMLKERDPQRYALICDLYKEGIGQLRLADLLNVSIHTVRAVLESEKLVGTVTDDNEEDKRRMRQVRRLMLEGIEEDAVDPERRKKIAARDKAVIVGIVTQNHELLDGNATQRVEVVTTEKPAVEDFVEWLKHGATKGEEVTKL